MKSSNLRDQSALNRLQEISQELLGQLDLDLLLELILEGVVDLLDADYGHLTRYEPKSDELISWIPLRTPQGIIDAALKRGEGLSGKVLKTGKPMIITDYDTWSGRSAAIPAGITGPCIGVAVIRGDDFLGVLSAIRIPGGPTFTSDDLDLLTLFANQAAVAIINARMYQEVSQRAEEMTLLYETSLEINKDIKLDAAINTILERTTYMLNVKSANLRLFDAETEMFVPYIPNQYQDNAGSLNFKPGEGVSGIAFVEKEAVVANDYDAWKKRSDQIPRGSVARAVAVPLRQGDEVVGVLTLDRNLDEPPFTDTEVRLLTLFANHVTTVVVNAQQYEELQRLYQEVAEKERLDRELQLASTIQASFLEEKGPDVPGWDLAAHWHPAQQVGGDFYDFIPLESERWGIVIGDVAGKGIPAALFMALCKSVIRAYAIIERSPKEVLHRANQEIISQSRSGLFVTALYGIVDGKEGTLTLSNAGHNPPLMKLNGQGEIKNIRFPGVIMGVFEDAVFEEKVVTFSKGDSMLLYTDGVPDALNADREELGMSRLSTFFENSNGKSSEKILRSLLKKINAFVGDAKQFDDLTYLILKR